MLIEASLEDGLKMAGHLAIALGGESAWSYLIHIMVLKCIFFVYNWTKYLHYKEIHIITLENVVKKEIICFI